VKVDHVCQFLVELGRSAVGRGNGQNLMYRQERDYRLTILTVQSNFHTDKYHPSHRPTRVTITSLPHFLNL
jgi:hypothetical protein